MLKKGRIIKTYKGFYYVWDGHILYECRLRGRLKKDKPDILTGDLVSFTSTDESEGIIEEISPRHSVLNRPAIANIDQVLLIVSIRQPDLSLGLLDRFLIQIESQGLDVIIGLTKMDLYSSEEATRPLEYYEKIGYSVKYLSIGDQKNDWLDLKEALREKITVLAGPSGAGKSSLIHTFRPQEAIQIGAVSEKIGRGRHTTKHAELLHWEDCFIADTPGFTSLSLKGWKINEPKDYFPDFLELSEGCKFKNSCIHLNEPQCAVKEAVEAGGIPQWRYESYLSILNEIQNGS